MTFNEKKINDNDSEIRDIGIELLLFIYFLKFTIKQNC